MEPIEKDPRHVKKTTISLTPASSQSSSDTSEPASIDDFRTIWPLTTVDHELTLYGFSRFRTAHLLNLRFLESEIKKLDAKFYRVGQTLDTVLGGGSIHQPYDSAKSLEASPTVEEVATRVNVDRLLQLLKQYDEALISFNQVVNMETFSLGANTRLALHRGLSRDETFKTRLVRIDLPAPSIRDPLRRFLHHYLRKFYKFYTGRTQSQYLDEGSPASHSDNNTYQNTIRITDVMARFLVAFLAGVLLDVPLILLSYQSSRSAHLLTVSVCIVTFSMLVSLASKASNVETMAAAAAYAAVLAVFVSTVPQNTAGSVS